MIRAVSELYRNLEAVIDGSPVTRGLRHFANRLVAQLEAVDDVEWQALAEDPMSDDLVDLLDSTFLDQVPVAGEPKPLLEERGWDRPDEARARRPLTPMTC